MDSDTQAISYDPFSLEAMKDPQPFYKRLREETRAYPLPQYHSWAIPCFADVWDIFLDRDRFTEAEGQVFPREMLEAPLGTVPQPKLEPLDIFNNQDPPVHGVIRRAMGASLQPAAVSALEPMIRELVRQRLDVLAETGRMDINLDLASHVSAGAACHIVGFGQSEIIDTITLVNRSMERTPGQSGMTVEGWAAVGEIHSRLKALVQQRRAGPISGDSRMIDGLIGLKLAGRGPLSDDEVAQQLVSILIGGTESLPKVISGGLRQLWKQPEQRAEVAADPAKNATSAVEEMIRMFAPAQWFGRTLKVDAEIAGQPMRVGERVLLLTASANRDEQEFQNADEFHWNRKMRRVVAFGMGPHFCIGIHIARLEARLIVEELLRRFPDYEIDEAAGQLSVSEFQIGWVKLPIIVHANRISQ